MRVVAAERRPQRDEGLLQQVVSLFRVAGQPPEEAIQGLLVTADQIAERALIAEQSTGDEIAIVVGGGHSGSAVRAFTTVRSSVAACVGVSTARIAKTCSIVSFCN